VKACQIAILVLLAGCARLPPPIAVPEPAVEPGRGQVAYRFLLDPTSAVLQLADQTEFVAPIPKDEFSLPRYPRTALDAKAGPAHVVVRILIGTDGRIADVRDSPLEASSSGPFAGEFRDAVLRALRHWRFTPGRIDQVTGKDLDGDGQPDYREVIHYDLVPVFYDVRFDFETVGDEGRVKTSAAPS
jgi:hypothetical protein